jgi:hypothetical protein
VDLAVIPVLQVLLASLFHPNLAPAHLDLQDHQDPPDRTDITDLLDLQDRLVLMDSK